MATQARLIEDLRDLLVDEPVIREVSMFGGRAFMVNEKMLVSAQKDGGLLVRVAADQHENLLTRPGAEQAEMGAAGDMGPGWIKVVSASAGDEDTLKFWVDIALEHNRAVTGGSK